MSQLSISTTFLFLFRLQHFFLVPNVLSSVEGDLGFYTYVYIYSVVRAFIPSARRSKSGRGNK